MQMQGRTQNLSSGIGTMDEQRVWLLGCTARTESESVRTMGVVQ